MTYRIGIVCYPTVGGSGVVATELGKKLARKGHRIHFISSSMPYRLDECHDRISFHEVEVNQYAVFRYPPYDLALASKIAEVARRVGLDIIHAHYAVPHAVCAYLAKKMVGRLKVVTTLHGTDITVLGYDPTLQEAIRFGIEQSDAVTCVSCSLAEQTRALIGTDREIIPIHNFINEAEYHCQDRSFRDKLNLSPKEKVIIHISNFRPVKRVDDVIHTFRKVLSYEKAKLLLVGDGPEKTTAFRLVHRLGLEKDVIFFGKQDSIAPILSASDVLILTSEKESFGLVLLEAMASGVPVVATNTGGIPEVVVNDKTGFLCNVGDTDEMAEKIILLLGDADLRKKMGLAGLRRVEEVFHSEKIVASYEKVYASVLENGR